MKNLFSLGLKIITFKIAQPVVIQTIDILSTYKQCFCKIKHKTTVKRLKSFSQHFPLKLLRIIKVVGFGKNQATEEQLIVILQFNHIKKTDTTFTQLFGDVEVVRMNDTLLQIFSL